MASDRTTGRRGVPAWLGAVAALLLTALPAAAQNSPAHTVRRGLGSWWLPYNYSHHGGEVDALFAWIFWITMVTFVAVEVTLVIFCVKYRSRPGKAKGVFLHGNTRLEMIWTLVPAVILFVLAFASKRVWDRFRYADDSPNAPKPVDVLVIGEQFKWNFVYPGPDGKLGRYLVFPKPTDPRYRALPYEKAISKINNDILENPLGQDQNFDATPEAGAGKDDDYTASAGRSLILPVETPLNIWLSSKDVIHDFFMPNMRVKLDAVPGMRGQINFTARQDALSLAEMGVEDGAALGKAVWIDARTPGATRTENGPGSTYDVAGVQSLTVLDAPTVAKLRGAGLRRVQVVTRPFELVCEELCGQGHTSMRGEVIFVTPQQYHDFIFKPEPGPAGPTMTAQPAAPQRVAGAAAP